MHEIRIKAEGWRPQGFSALKSGKELKKIGTRAITLESLPAKDRLAIMQQADKHAYDTTTPHALVRVIVRKIAKQKDPEVIATYRPLGEEEEQPAENYSGATS